MSTVHVLSAIEARVLADIQAGTTTIAQIATRLGYTRRDVEAAIESLRLVGEPIVGGNEGLRYATDPADLELYVERRRHRAASIHRGTLALRGTLRRLRERTDLTLGF